MTNAMVAFWQDVAEETTNELVGCECHRLPTVAMVSAIVLVSERYAIGIDPDETPVRDRNAPLSVALQRLPGSG